MNSQLRRTILDFGPLLLFFAAYKLFNLTVATGTVMAAASVAVCVGYW
jgi:intracellular septation protein